MSHPFVSIIMPVKNAGLFLEECLDSIIFQSYSNWELLAVNDHSTDNSSDILRDYQNKEKRIQAVHSNGNGIIEALQTGYALSKGTYITRMDADDIMPLDKLTIMSQSVEENPESLITGKVKYINNLKRGYTNYQNWLNKLVDTQTHYNEIYKECVIPSPCWMLQRDTFKKCGGFNSNTYPEDYDLCFRYYQHKIPIVAIDQVLHIWRDHKDRASRNDAHYSDNSFLELKMKYFLKIDYRSNKTLILWGAGDKSKRISRLLIDKKINFEWICNSKNKIGRTIYGKIVKNIESLDLISEKAQVIIAVANPEDQKDIRQVVSTKNNLQSFWFC